MVPRLNLLTLKPDVGRVTAVVVTGLGEVAAVTLLAGLDDAVAAEADLDGWVRVVSRQGEEAVVDAVDLEKSAVFESTDGLTEQGFNFRSGYSFVVKRTSLTLDILYPNTAAGIINILMFLELLLNLLRDL